MVPYTYTILRYVHDPVSGECINVGVALYAPGERFLGSRLQTTTARIVRVFEDADGRAIRAGLRAIEAAFRRRAETLTEGFFLEGAETVSGIAEAICPRDDSALQWSTPGGGLTGDPTKTLRALYDRFVGRYEERAPSGKTDDQVWGAFKKELATRNLLFRFEPKRISVQDDEVEFQHAVKNGVWHCLEPLSFDLTPDGMRDKAHKWLGQLASIRGSEDRFKVYFLVGGPSDPQLRPAFDAALSILRKSPVQQAIFQENEAHLLPRALEEQGIVMADTKAHSSHPE